MLENYLLSLLRKRDYSEKELLTKSLQKGFEKSDFEEVITKFLIDGLVNDKSLAERLVTYYREELYYGKYKVKLSLLKRGIPSNLVSDLYDSISEEMERELILKALTKRLAQKNENLFNLSYSRKLTTANWLRSKGFDTELISEVLNIN